MLTFAGLAFLCLPGWRYLAARALSYGIGQGLVGGRRVVTLGEAAELERLSPSDFLQFGIDEIARVALIGGDRSGHLGEAQRAQVARAMELAYDLRASPLAVRLFPDRKVRSILRQRDGLNFKQYFSSASP